MVNSDSKDMKKESRRLVGWLVSYALDKKGASFELRAGRYLIGSKEVESGFTIVVQAADISSPHLALRASANHTVTVQDIFSEHGSSLTRADSGEESKIEGPVQVRHGDWLQIGKNNRFQVCLIDGSAR